MKKSIKIVVVITLTANLLNACGASSTSNPPSHSSVVQQKVERAGNRTTNRVESTVDQKTDNAIDRAVDNVFKKIF